MRVPLLGALRQSDRNRDVQSPTGDSYGDAVCRLCGLRYTTAVAHRHCAGLRPIGAADLRIVVSRSHLLPVGPREDAFLVVA